MQNPIPAQFTQEQIDDFFIKIAIEEIEDVRAYLDAGMSPNAISNTNMTALQAALFDGSVDIASMLITSGADCKGPGVRGGSLVHDATYSLMLVKQLMSNGADHLAIDSAGFDTVYSAANDTSMRVLEHLAASGCVMDRRFPSEKGKMAIHAAAWHFDEDVVATFVKLGVPIESVDDELRGVVHYCALSQYIPALNSAGDRSPFLKTMVDIGADIDAKDIYGRTALHYAAEFKNPSIAASLIAHGARANIPDNDGLYPSDLASESAKSLIASVMAKHEIANILEKSRPSGPRP